MFHDEYPLLYGVSLGTIMECFYILDLELKWFVAHLLILYCIMLHLAHLLMHHCSHVPSLEEYLAHMLRHNPILLVIEGIPTLFMDLVEH
jgi:hypothetical protein